MDKEKRRVKLYILNADKRWTDVGTGHVIYSYLNSEYTLTVHSERDDSLLLNSKICQDIVYEKQQDTLIVWSEDEDKELALSFQDKAGCDAIWKIICRAKGQDPNANITHDYVIGDSEEEDISDVVPDQNIHLPPCEINYLEEIHETMRRNTTSHGKEKLADTLYNEGYVAKLLNLYCLCEENCDFKSIKNLQDIFIHIISLGKAALLEEMFKVDNVFNLVGCLEYCPESPGACQHKKFLKDIVHYKEVIPINNSELENKIHETFRVQYIYDVVLARRVAVEECLSACLSVYLYLNRAAIVTMINGDKNFLKNLFSLLNDRKLDMEKRVPLMLFLKQLCCFSHTLQQVVKESFYNSLFNLNIIRCLGITTMINDEELKLTALEVLQCIVETFPVTARSYILLEVDLSPSDNPLTSILIREMIGDFECELPLNILKLLLHPETMGHGDRDRTAFIKYFFQRDMTIIIDFLLNNTSDINWLNGQSIVHKLGFLLDLLAFCVNHHCDYMRSLIINNDLLKYVMILMKSPHKFISLSALRLMRCIIALKDDGFNKYIMNGNLFAPVVEAFLRNKGRYNLLDSAILEMFEFIRVEEMKCLCAYIVETYGSVLDDMNHIPTFQKLKCCCKKEPEKSEAKGKLLPCLQKSLQRSLVKEWCKALNLQPGEDVSVRSIDFEISELQESDTVVDRNSTSIIVGQEPALATRVDTTENTTPTLQTSKYETGKKKRLVEYDDDEEDGEDRDDDGDDDGLGPPERKRRRIT